MIIIIAYENFKMHFGVLGTGDKEKIKFKKIAVLKPNLVVC